MRHTTLRIPTQCAVGKSHAVHVSIDVAGVIQRIACDCCPTDPEIVIMRSIGEKTCLDRVAYIHALRTDTNYLYENDIKRDWPESGALCTSVATWLRTARSAHYERTPQPTPAPDRLSRMEAIMRRAVPRTADTAREIVGWDLTACNSRSDPTIYAQLEIRDTAIAYLHRAGSRSPTYAVLAANREEPKPSRARKSADSFVCRLCNADDTTAHRTGPRHMAKVVSLARSMLGRLNIELRAENEVSHATY